MTSKIKSLFKKSSLFSQEFTASLDKPKGLSFNALDLNLDDSLRYFNFHEGKDALMVYVLKSNNPKINNLSIEKNLLNNPQIAEMIKKRFSFLGITSSNPEVDKLKSFGIKERNFPCFIFFTYDLNDELKVHKLINLDNELTLKSPEQVLKAMDEISKSNDLLKEQEKKLGSQIENKKVNQNRFNDHTGYGYDDDHEYNNPYPTKTEEEFSRIESDRRIKLEQEQAYKKMVEKQRAEEKIKKDKQTLEDQQKQAEVQKKANLNSLKEKFDKMIVPEGLGISISLRFPSGQRINKDFPKKELVKMLYDFALIQDKKGFENENNEFGLFAGFPLKKLDSSKTFEQTFGDSSGELVHVNEIGKD